MDDFRKRGLGKAGLRFAGEGRCEAVLEDGPLLRRWYRLRTRGGTRVCVGPPRARRVPVLMGRAATLRLVGCRAVLGWRSLAARSGQRSLGRATCEARKCRRWIGRPTESELGARADASDRADRGGGACEHPQGRRRGRRRGQLPKPDANALTVRGVAINCKCVCLMLRPDARRLSGRRLSGAAEAGACVLGPGGVGVG
jgi:hypothetical protein